MLIILPQVYGSADEIFQPLATIICSVKRRLFNALAAASLAVMIFFAVALVCSRFGDPIWQFTVAGRFFCIHPFRNHVWLASVQTGPGKFPGFGQEHRLPRTTLVVLRCEPADPNGWSIGIEAGYPLLLVTSAALPIVWLTRFTVLRRRHRE